MNQIEVKLEPLGENAVNVYIRAFVDGDKEFWTWPNFNSESFTNLDEPTDSEFAEYRDTPQARIVRTGDCVEECCPSLMADVYEADGRVIWENFRYTVRGMEQDEAEWRGLRYEFDAAKYKTAMTQAVKVGETKVASGKHIEGST